jgi:hypothetical protein
MSRKVFNWQIHVSEEERMMIKVIADHYKLPMAPILRVLVKREYERIKKGTPCSSL